MPCQVPRASLPFEMGMFRDAPIRELLTCAGISSMPAQDVFGLAKLQVAELCAACFMLVAWVKHTRTLIQVPVLPPLWHYSVQGVIQVEGHLCTSMRSASAAEACACNS